MPSPDRVLEPGDIRRQIDDDVFHVRGDRQVGLELEWLTGIGADGAGRPGLAELERLVSEAPGRLSGGSRISIEPGGQLELSTPPRATARECCEIAGDDLYRFDRLCAESGIQLVAVGADPHRRPERVVTAARYSAMQRYLDGRSSDGMRMMTNSAAIQLNLGLGTDEDDMRRRWVLLNRLGPVLIASFANSPFQEGRISGWHSTRMRWWLQIDRSRTAPVPLGGDPREAWLRYALDANVMLVRCGPDAAEAIDVDLPFGRWMTEGHELGWPTEDDFSYHLTTLFPPVRPRGWFELRVFDALPTPFWHVAVSVVAAVLDDRAAADRVGEVIAGTEGLWADAARLALGHPVLARAARDTFQLALGVVTADGDAATRAVVGTYFERWVARGRTPADDQMDHFRRTGEVLPPSESPIPYAEFEAVTS